MRCRRQRVGATDAGPRCFCVSRILHDFAAAKISKLDDVLVRDKKIAALQIPTDTRGRGGALSVSVRVEEFYGQQA